MGAPILAKQDAALLVPLAAGNILLVDDMLISGSCVTMHGSRPVSSEATGCTNTCPARGNEIGTLWR